ncbi:MAG: mannose-6-phosphate isomerase, class I [Chitinophagaceae bacterium]|nr:mannose-6-phosphate isomerase, class I [Chitinophagaceae bacterium]HRN47848.1 mannose-6-phosphate isomerase, class I [Niabella sp.]
MKQQIALLKGDPKPYDWGGSAYIPSLLQIENPNQQPYAEYWMGVHPQAKCLLHFNDGQEMLLREYIAGDPENLLGERVFKTFGNMPYLLKVLDVKDMLSIQVHPPKKQAAIDFEEENKKGIPLNAPNRNYKDTNHKPELMVAMSEFYLLHGFKPEKELLNILHATPELNLFIPVFEKEGYAGLYKMAMELPQEEVNELLQPLLNRIVPLYQQKQLSKNDENFWAARASLTFAQPNVIDRGIFSIYFFNVLHLNEGDAIFQDAGMPHAYLEGYNVEIMASSDNVLRGGLTTKHIDTVELLKHTKCEATIAKIIKNQNKAAQVFKTPAADFELSSFRLGANEQANFKADTAEIYLLISGEATLKSGNDSVTLKKGAIAAAGFSGAEITISTSEGALVFRASVP